MVCVMVPSLSMKAKEMEDVSLVMCSGRLTHAGVRTKCSFAHMGLRTTSSRSCSFVYIASLSGSDTGVPWKITHDQPAHGASTPLGKGCRRMWAIWVILVNGML